ncbi:MAG: winged helix-turn-helix domain-containing protein [Pseudomonadota bacterium]
MRYEFADCVLDVDRHVLTRQGEAVPVEPQVFDLLKLLAEHPGKLVARDEIIERVWNGRFVSESTISARVAAARRAVGDDGKAQRIIRTIVRRGLQLAADVTCEGDPLHGPAQQHTQRLRYAHGKNGLVVPYTLNGEGLPVLRIGSIIHDLEAEWRLTSERKRLTDLANRFHLLRYNKDHGVSSNNDHQAVYDHRLEEILTVADAVDFDRFSIIGEFGGAFPALHFAARHSDRVNKLVIAGGWAEGRDHRADSGQPDSIRTLIAEGWHMPGGGYAIGSTLSYFPDGPLDDVRDMVTEMQTLYSRDQKLHYRDVGNSMTAMDLLPQVRCPTLILHGRHATVHPLSEAHKLASGIPDASLVILETANQIPLPGNKAYAAYINAIDDFLNADA